MRFDPPLASDDCDPEEPVPEVMSVTVVADGAEIVVGAFGALPSAESRRKCKLEIYVLLIR